MVDSNSLKNHPEIERTRRYLIIILVTYFIFDLIEQIFNYNIGLSQLSGTLIGILFICSILLYGINIFVVYRFSSLGIQIFIGIHIVILAIEVILSTIMAITVVTALHVVSQLTTQDVRTEKILTAGSAIFCVYGIVKILEFIISIITIVLSFKLARLITANECATIEQL